MDMYITETSKTSKCHICKKPIDANTEKLKVDFGFSATEYAKTVCLECLWKIVKPVFGYRCTTMIIRPSDLRPIEVTATDKELSWRHLDENAEPRLKYPEDFE